MAEEWTGGRAFDDPEGYHAWLLTMDADDPEVQRVDREIDAICRAVLTDLLPAGLCAGQGAAVGRGRRCRLTAGKSAADVTSVGGRGKPLGGITMVMDHNTGDRPMRRWTLETAADNLDGEYREWLLEVPEDDPEFVRFGAELEAAWQAELAAMPPAQRALAMLRFEREVDACTFGEDEDDGDDPEPDGGEALPTPPLLEAMGIRGPPPKAGPPARDGSGRQGDGQDNHGAANIDPPSAAPQEQHVELPRSVP